MKDGTNYSIQPKLTCASETDGDAFCKINLIIRKCVCAYCAWGGVSFGETWRCPPNLLVWGRAILFGNASASDD